LRAQHIQINIFRHIGAVFLKQDEYHILEIILSNIEIDHIHAKPGEKTTGFLKVGSSSINTYRIPVAILNGIKEGKKLCLLGGTHGTEFASIEAITRIIQSLDPKKMTGAILAVPVVNGPQFEHRSAFLSPFDQLNQNRQFPGDPTGTLSKRTAHTVFSKIASKADALVDCHGGDITEDLDCYVIARVNDDENLNKKALEMAKCFPGKVIMAKGGGTLGTSGEAQDLYGIPCITPEAGVPYPVRERHVRFHYDGIINLLKYMGIIEGKPTIYDAKINPKEYTAKAMKGGIWYPNVEVGDFVEKGQNLGTMKDLFGNIHETITSPEKGWVRFLRVWYSVNIGEPLVTVSYI
jgi:predicted deacylase